MIIPDDKFDIGRPTSISLQVMFILSPLLQVLSFSFPVSGTPFRSTKDGALQLLESPTLVEPMVSSNASTLPFDTSAGNNLNIRCDGETYGYNPNIIDCHSAKEYINPETTIWTMGERHTGLPDITVPLPYRIMGDKGLCYIQPVLIGDHTTAKASLSMVRRAAVALIMQCAISTVAQGGIATNIGKIEARLVANRSFARSCTDLYPVIDARRW